MNNLTKITGKKRLYELNSIGHFIDKEGLMYPVKSNGEPDWGSCADLDSGYLEMYRKGEHDYTSKEDQLAVTKTFDGRFQELSPIVQKEYSSAFLLEWAQIIFGRAGINNVLQRKKTGVLLRFGNGEENHTVIGYNKEDDYFYHNTHVGPVENPSNKIINSIWHHSYNGSYRCPKENVLSILNNAIK